VNSIGPYILIWYLAYRSLDITYWITLALGVVAAGFLVRAFIILHDCGHGAFFRSQKANDVLGTVMGYLTFTPYHRWRYDHAVHHASCADLDRRSVGDIWTLTVDEPLPRLERRTILRPSYFHRTSRAMNITNINITTFSGGRALVSPNRVLMFSRGLASMQ
jgi:omega-6 fatty acid desaturase (delta-12 desaturase)